MLVVNIEIWPGGDADEAFTVAHIEAANIGGLITSAYEVEISQTADPSSLVHAIEKSFVVRGHRRADGPLELVRRIIEQARES